MFYWKLSLIEAGAHIDAVNSFSETPFETATTGFSLIAHILDLNVVYDYMFVFDLPGVAEIILRTQSKLSLKCIAAKAIKRYAINYKGTVLAKMLINFVWIKFKKSPIFYLF